jgi:hypothetical protein
MLIHVTELGTLLARLGGADPKLLDEAPGQRSRFIQMGIVLLSTSGLAVLSMAFALRDALHAPVVVAALLGLIWGAIILNLDRLLILTMRPGGTRWRLAAMIAPRIVMAALLGIVIATPLTLRIFASEIEKEMILGNAQQAGILGTARQEDPRVAELAAVNADIKRYEDVLAGRVQYSSPNLTQAQSEYDAASKDYAAKTKAYEDAYSAWRCELDGDRCSGASGKQGAGPRADSLKQTADLAQQDMNASAAVLQQKQNVLTVAQADNKTANDGKLAQDQAEANRQLPGKRATRDRLEAELGALTSSDSRVVQDTGLLARIDALGRLGDKSTSAFLAHLAVAGLLFMIELLPVMVKALSILGPPTVYDKLSDLNDKTSLEESTRKRQVFKRKNSEIDNKAKQLDEDMLVREIALGKKANAHVAAEMDKIMALALRHWSNEVARTLHGQGPPHQGPPSGPSGPGPSGPTSGPNGSGPNASGPPPQGAPGGSGVPPQGSGPRLRDFFKKLNLPPTKGARP